MKFKDFYRSRNVDFDRINKAMLENLQDHAFTAKSKKGINKYLLMTNEDLESIGFYQLYPHLR